MDTADPFRRLLGEMPSPDPVEWGGSPHLRRLLESQAYRTTASMLTMAMGETCEGQPYLADLQACPHLVIAGLADTGKTTFLRGLLATLLLRCSPADMRLFLYSADPRAFQQCNGLPHLLVPPTSDDEAAVAFLEWVRHEMDRRYRVLQAAGVRNIDRFNEVPPLLALLDSVERPCRDPRRMPYLVAVFDDLGGLSHRWTDDLLDQTGQLCQMSRAVGIHLVVATPTLSVRVLPSYLLVNIPARLSFRQEESLASAVVLGRPGAEALTEAGEALYVPPTTRRTVSLRTPYVSDEWLWRVVAAWREGAGVA